MAALVMAATACLSATAACGGDDEPSEAQGTTSSSTAPPETTAPPTTLTPEQEVEAAYHEFAEVMAELAPAPNPDDPRLAELVLDPQLSTIRDNFASLAATNQYFEKGAESTYTIAQSTVDATGVTATIIVCTVGADKKIDGDTGDVLADGVSTLENSVTYRQHDGRWMLENIANLRSWQGVTQCDG
jgi:hypothetical protein